MPSPLERKINRLLRKVHHRHKHYPGFVRVTFQITCDDFCDVVEFKDGSRWYGTLSSFRFRSTSYRERFKLMQTAQKTGFRHPEKPLRFDNPNIECQFKTYGELYKTLTSW